jgi:acyl-coenzyme A thioesterase PaaI-like protein
MSVSEPRTPPFYTRYGIARTGDAARPLVIEPYAHVCHAGVLRATVIAAAVDIVGSLFAREIAGSDSLFTTDLSVRAPARSAPERVELCGRLLHAGRSVIASEALLEADGVPFAFGQTTFRRMPRPDARPGDVERLALPEHFERVSLERPLVAEVGPAIVDASRGRVELPLRDALRNPEGGMQGALVALLVEVAALARADHEASAVHVVTELDLRYLASGRVGPIVSSAAWVAGRVSEVLRVELVDRGRDDRLTTTALVRVAPAPDANG